MSVRGALLGVVVCLTVGGLVGLPQQAPAVSIVDATPVPPSAALPVLDVLRGDTWLRHHREDLMPYWDMPEALGQPVGNFPTFRGRDGELLPDTTRGLVALARGVYGYSLAFMLTGEERYLGYARAGLDWIDAKAKDPVHGGYFGLLNQDGSPVNPLANKDVFDLASLGLAYGMYFNATRDPAVEADLLAVRDLIFTKYYDPVANRIRDSLTYDLVNEVDTGGNGGDITDLLVPGTALLLPNVDLLHDPARRTQFRDDLRRVTEILLARHKNSAATANAWWFWGRSLRFGNFGAAETDFGHNIKSYEMIHNANQMYADRPWSGLATDRDALLAAAWDDPFDRWNERLRSFAGTPSSIERDSAWWIHAEADQTLAALDLSDGFAHQQQLADSAQSWLKVFVDRESPARETVARVSRVAADNDPRKSFRGKNMLHAHEHALIMYLHGRALEGLPARLFYAFPQDEALTAVAKPYWFDATGQSRTVRSELPALPGHQLVEVWFTGLDAVPAPLFPPPADSEAPRTVATVTPVATDAGWHRSDVTVTLTSSDVVSGVQAIHASVTERGGAVPATALIDPGEAVVLPALRSEGVYDVTYYAVDRLGNAEEPQTLTIRLDLTAPEVGGLPTVPCVMWPPNGRMVQVADVVGTDALSGVALVQASATSSEPALPGDIVVDGARVQVRATRAAHGPGRTYTVIGSVTDNAGNTTSATGTCLVPHDRRR